MKKSHFIASCIEFALIWIDVKKKKNLHKHICRGYILEAPQNASNEQHEKRFHVETRKISLFFFPV